MADVERTPTDEERATQLLVRFKDDLLKLALQGEYGERGYVVMLGMLDVAEGLMRRSLRLDPSPLPILLARIKTMQANVEQSGQPDVPVAVVKH